MVENVFEGQEVEIDEQPVKTVEADKEEAPLKEIDENVAFGELSDNVGFDVILKPGDEAKVFTIKSAEYQKPRLKDANGKSIPMEAGKNYYKSKLVLTYEEGNYASYIPSLKWFLSEKDDKQVLNPWFAVKLEADCLDDNFVPEISKLYYRYCQKFNLVVGKFTQLEFKQGLVGKQVKLKTTKQKNPLTGKMGHRIDVVEFI